MLGDLGKLIVAKGFKTLPKVQKSPDLVTLVVIHKQCFFKKNLLNKQELIPKVAQQLLGRLILASATNMT